MKPGQLSPNELELEILKRILKDSLERKVSPMELHVLSREYTGVGSFTNFSRVRPQVEGPQEILDLKGLIEISGVPNGLGALLILINGEPDCLEIYCFGDKWDGTFVGFSFGEAT